MAGHSKWANIKHRKGAQDKRRGKIFSKLSREIMIAARAGGEDLDTNYRLRMAVDKARAQSMPKDNIERAIKRATGDAEGAAFEEVRYEGYGPGGVAVMVDVVTDNRNRSVADVRHAFSKHGGNLGADGSVGYLFNRVGLLSYTGDVDADRIMEQALSTDAEDVVTNDDGSVEVLTAPEDYESVMRAMEAAGLKPEESEVTMRAFTSVPLGEEAAEQMLKLLEALEDLDDVQQVYSNADIAEDILERLVS